MNGSSYNNNGSSKNKTTANSTVDQMKYEIANEFGVNLGPDATARQNGTVGGEITRRLVRMAQNNMGYPSNK